VKTEDSLGATVISSWNTQT